MSQFHDDPFVPGIVFEKKPDDASVIYFANNYDVTSSAMKGADRAPAAIRAMLAHQIETRERYTGIDLVRRTQFSWHDLGQMNGLSPEAMVARAKQAYGKLAALKNKPLIIGIGGDHSTPIGIFQAIASRRDPGEVTILHIDAHFDLRDIDEFRKRPYGKFAHCCVMRRAHELGFRIVSVGARDYSEEELEYTQKHKETISFFELGRGKPWGIKDVLKAIATKKLYVSIDADGFDPSVFPVTGTQVPGGMSWDFGVELLKKTISRHILVGADICEAAVSVAEPFATYRSIFSAGKLAYLIPCLARK